MPMGKSVASTKPVTARSRGLNTRHPARVQGYGPFSSTRSPDHSNMFMASATQVPDNMVNIPRAYRSTPVNQCSVRSRACRGVTPYVPQYPSSMHAAWIWNRRLDCSVLVQRDCSASWGSGTIPRSSAIARSKSTDMMMPVQRRKQILNRVNRPKPSAQRLRMFRILRCIGPHSQLILQPDVRTAESLGGGTECGEMCKRFEGNGIGKRGTQIVQFVHNLQGVERFGGRVFHAMLHSTMLRRERDQLLGGKQATCCPTLPGRSMRDSRRRLPGR